MKDSWEIKTLDEISSDKKFAIVDGPFGTQLHASEYTSEGVPVIRVVNLSYEGSFDDSKLVFISNKKANDLKRSEVVANDIIIAKTGATIGKSGLFPQKFERGIIASSCIKLSVAKDKGFYKYYLYLLSSEQGQKEILDGAGGSTRTTINVLPFKKIAFKVPPLPQQRKIAQILSTVDAVLEKTEAAIAKYQQLKQGLMHDVFTRGINLHTGQLRPKKTEAPELYKQSALGWIPKEWEAEELGNVIIGKGDYGINAAAVNFDPKYHTYLRITDISDDGHFIEEGKKSVNHIEAINFILEDGDIVFARTGNSTGKTYLYNRNDGVLVFAGFLIRFKPDSTKLNPMFLKFITETPYYKNWVSVYSARTGQPGINGNEYSKLSFVLPSIEEQLQIAQKLKSIDQKIHTEQQALAKYQQLKAGLLQDLLTGRVEVSV